MFVEPVRVLLRRAAPSQQPAAGRATVALHVEKLQEFDGKAGYTFAQGEH